MGVGYGRMHRRMGMMMVNDDDWLVGGGVKWVVKGE